MTSDALIIDGYVDEPACLGVPPYLSPYIRTVAGVLIEAGYRVQYRTIDQVRSAPQDLANLRKIPLTVVIAGQTVPGKYLSGTPATLTELRQLGTLFSGTTALLGGPIAYGISPGGGKAAVSEPIAGYAGSLAGDPATSLFQYLEGFESDRQENYEESSAWSVRGAEIIRQHPCYPHLMLELETAKGCPRSLTGGCSFCTEPFLGSPRYRPINRIEEEVAALAEHGATHFRIGRQPDLLVYGSSGGAFPRPEPEKIEALFHAIRRAAPDLQTLHIDNVNPATIARHQEAATEALEAVVAGHTAGDIAAFGMETADPVVIERNNLKASPEEVMDAIGIVNTIGGKRDTNGVPHLLPGLNFVCGLAGETADTYCMNREFLTTLLNEGLLVRRVNIRQLMPFAGTAAYRENTLDRHQSLFRSFKEWTRKEFDTVMLQRVFPQSTLLRDAVVEIPGRLSFARQMGTYPILIGLPLEYPAQTVLDCVVVGYGSRSVTALPSPIPVNRLPKQALSALPGIGKKTAAAIVVRRPIRSHEEWVQVTGGTALDHLIVFDGNNE
ncbi:MAG: radical SAM protein [Methanocalculus sp. MSAO_Arc1]|uniref:radical SAM protein n=1 Tax=Methanocalculus TaxID=71151 RepID=UPI000FF1562B|nr:MULTISPECIES: radical SAM protein [unclassified Methanocalculus]MCP1662199.1 radical SAM superfamily enzyme with C-terminal helix-hairpin-helix motif [Methanocalculus sp. AMF5]RQD81658.1 MAG: radical SAM protein [Methanocalculus sp. MSAO_Arc1]